MQYLVNWKALFKDLFKKLVAILGSIFIALSILEFVDSGYDFCKTFKHIEIIHIPIIVAVIVVASFLFALIVSLASKISAITITDKEALGRNYFSFKKALPFAQIIKAYHQSEHGFESIVLFGGSFLNSIYFPVFLIEIDDAVQRLKQENITIED